MQICPFPCLEIFHKGLCCAAHQRLVVKAASPPRIGANEGECQRVLQLLGWVLQVLRMASMSEVSKASMHEPPTERPSGKPVVLTGADPVSQLDYQLERRGSFNPVESSAGLPPSVSVSVSRGSSQHNIPQPVTEGTSDGGSDSYDDADLSKRSKRQGSRDSLIMVRCLA